MRRTLTLLLAMLMASVDLAVEVVKEAWNRSKALATRMVQGTAIAPDTAANTSLATIGVVVVAVIAAILVPIIAIQVLALLLPDYFTALGDIFAAFSATNTTEWPTIVGSFFTFAPLVIGVVAIASLFGIGGFIALKALRR